MKLIDLLVQELPERGGWPKNVTHIGQDYDRELMFYGRGRAMTGIFLDELAIDHRKCGGSGAEITQEQYESALSASKEPLTGIVVDDWIEWSGGECPVNASEMVDVIFGRGGIMSTNIADCWRWNHSGTDSDIIAYRLHQPQEVEQAEADDEADLNECIGQEAAPVWNGEGLPPVGCECECQFLDAWHVCKVLFVGAEVIVGVIDGSERAFSVSHTKFRPLQSEADRKRNAAVEAIDYWLPEHTPDTPNEFYHAKKIYDAIAAGKIPGVKLDD